MLIGASRPSGEPGKVFWLMLTPHIFMLPIRLNKVDHFVLEERVGGEFNDAEQLLLDGVATTSRPQHLCGVRGENNEWLVPLLALSLPGDSSLSLEVLFPKCIIVSLCDSLKIHKHSQDLQLLYAFFHQQHHLITHPPDYITIAGKHFRDSDMFTTAFGALASVESAVGHMLTPPIPPATILAIAHITNTIRDRYLLEGGSTTGFRETDLRSRQGSATRGIQVAQIGALVTVTVQQSHAFAPMTVLSLVSSSTIDSFVFPTHRSLFAPPAPPKSMQVVIDSSTRRATSQASFPTWLPGRKAYGFRPNLHNQASATDHISLAPHNNLAVTESQNQCHASL
ncbi:hypothetical protein M378DRAFT_15757 [Amanita muscaria Koide BX008]|uniref:Uncharacterized protein n=1 Tax=Amanita muscaria (strain Koide BX008) TaxID=946122 RepID=A0A0C2SVS4_AMAMK|nr:hypothetical protein M378DRAFT_15757 [Amanita muscaria Koide BX008]